MSRSYRIRVRETLRRVIRATDHVSSQLELLEILPPEQMAGLLGQELANRGFKLTDGKAVRKEHGVKISVELASGTVVVEAQSQESVALSQEKEGRAYDDTGPNAKQVEGQLRGELQKDLEKQAEKQRGQLQKQVTEKLEGELADLKQELDQAVNRATAAALKLKAAQMGQIKQLTEDPASGSLTIVVEV